MAEDAISTLIRERNTALDEIDRLRAQLAASDGLLLLGWSLDDAIREHPVGTIGTNAREVYDRYPNHANTAAARRAGII